MPALLFGSISTLADTSEEQRAAFNQAFDKHGLDWSWGRDEYRELLTGNGGKDRVAEYAAQRGETVDAAAIHATKSEIFQQSLAGVPVLPRPGVAEAIQAARDGGWQIGLVTTTSPDNVAGLLDALDGHVSRGDFDVVIDATSVEDPKPDPAVYEYALKQLGVEATDAVAIEDNVGGARSAHDAGVRCVAFPNENTVTHDFAETPVVHRLEFADLQAAVVGR